MPHSNPLNGVSASAIQSIARRLLNLDVEAKKHLIEFDDKVIHIFVEDFNLAYYFSFKKGELFVAHQCEDAVSASISGRFSGFIGAAAAEHSSDSIFKGELNFSGEISTAKQFQLFVQSLSIDWHEPLAQLLGDPIGHSLATSIEQLSGWLFNTVSSVNKDISEYIQEEIKITPSELEQQHFFQNVDQLRGRADRLNAKITQLQQKRPIANSTESNL